MDGLTPLQKLRSTRALISENIVRFPTLLLEDLIRIVGYPYEWLKRFLNLYIFSKGGKYVWAIYPKKSPRNMKPMKDSVKPLQFCGLIGD